MQAIPVQVTAEQLLRNDYQQQAVSHCYLFSGPAGTGKTQMALSFAQWLNCLHPLPHQACGQCRSCLKIAQFSHPDVLFYFPESTQPDRIKILEERKANPFSNLVPDFNAKYKFALIKDIIHQITMELHEGNYKIVILAQAERLNRESANALLKNLEEPPSQTIFILTSDEPLNLLPTIKSRSRKIPFYAIDPHQISEFIKQNSIAVSIPYDLFLDLTQGSIGRIYQLLQFNLPPLDQFCQQILQSFSNPRFQKASALAEQFLVLSDEEKEIVIDGLLFYISRNLRNQLLPAEQKIDRFPLPEVLSYGPTAEKLLFILDRMKYLIRRNFNLSLIFINILINLDRLDDLQRIVTESTGTNPTF